MLSLETYRYSELAWSIEIPQGFGTSGATPAADTARELREETGFVATALEPLLTIGQDYVTHAFVARLDGDRPSRGGLEPTEAVRRYLWIARDEITPDRLTALGIREAMTLACLLALRVREV